MTETTTAIESDSPSEPAVEEQKPVETVEPDPNVTANGEKLDRQTRNWRALERDRDHWREMAMLHAKPQEPPPAPKVEPEVKRRTLADYNYDEAALAADVAKDAAAEAVKAARAEFERQAAEREKQQRERTFAARERDFAKKNPDYLELTRDTSVPLNDGIVDAVMDLEGGPEILLYLAKNVEVARSIAHLPERALAREIGRIDARLDYERKAAEAAAKRVSKAPAPVPKLDGVDASVEVSASDPASDKLAHDAWLARRNKEVRNRNR